MAHILRRLPSFVPELDYVAEAEDGTLVGSILYTRSWIDKGDGPRIETVSFGPLSVHSAYRNRGVGGALVRRTAALAREMGFPAILIYGHPDYYPRLGFRRAAEFGITTPDGKNFDAFMAMPLFDGALDGAAGRFYEDPAFDDMDAAAVKAFDASFPPREPSALPSADILYVRLPEPARSALKGKGITGLKEFHRFSGREIASLCGIGENEMRVLNDTLAEYGIPRKVGFEEALKKKTEA